MLKGHSWKVLALIASAIMVMSAGVVMAADQINIGVIAPFKTPPGEGLLNAAKMASDEINAQGGIAPASKSI